MIADTQAGLAITTGDIAVMTVCGVGLFFLANWFLTYRGPFALTGSLPRRNSIPFHLPFIQMGIWMVLVASVTKICGDRITHLPEWKQELCDYIVIATIEILLTIVFLYLGWVYFARRLKGLGLNFRTAARDIFAAAVNFIAVCPLVAFSMAAMIWIGRLVAGDDFQMQTNEGLKVITDNPQLSLRLVMIVFVVAIVPFFEEILFRGFLQSMARSFLNCPWIAILVTSVAFAALHPGMHFPALLALSCCMGYAYEKSGSLLRSIFIHAIFNAANVTLSLLQ